MKTIKTVTSKHKKQRAFRRAISRYFTLFCSQKWVLNSLLKSNSFRSFIDPRGLQSNLGEYRILYIPIENIKFHISDWIVLDKKEFHISDYFTIDGEWERCKKDINNMYPYIEAVELIKNDWKHRDTLAYKKYTKELQDGTPRRRQQILLDSIEKIDTYFLRYKSLYNSISKQGLLSNLEASKLNLTYQDREIGVAIDKDTTLVKLPGAQHRLALAKAMGIKKVPVEIRMIHLDLIKKHQLYSIEAIKKFYISHIICKNHVSKYNNANDINETF